MCLAGVFEWRDQQVVPRASLNSIIPSTFIPGLRFPIPWSIPARDAAAEQTRPKYSAIESGMDIDKMLHYLPRARRYFLTAVQSVYRSVLRKRLRAKAGGPR